MVTPDGRACFDVGTGCYQLRDYVMARPPSILNGVLQWRVTLFAAFHVHAGASS